MRSRILALLALLIATTAKADVTINGQLIKAQLEKLTSDPTGSEARIYWDTDDNLFRVYSGAAWLSVADLSKKLSAFAATSSSELQSVISDETGTGALYFAGGAAGTPSSINLTNGTALPIAGIASLGTGVGTWLATPSSANLASAVTGESGSGALLFGTSPTVSTSFTVQDSLADPILEVGSGGSVTIGSSTGGGSTNQAHTTYGIMSLYDDGVSHAQQHGIYSNSSAQYVIKNGNREMLIIDDGSAVTTIQDVTLKKVAATSSAQPFLKFTEDPDTGTDTVALQAPASVAASWSMTLPPDDGDAGEYLQTDGSGVATWEPATVAVGSVTGLGTGVATWLATPSSANLASALTGETGSGAVVFSASPTLTGDVLLQNAAGSQPTLKLSEDPDNGTNTVTIQSTATLAADYTLTLPVDDGSSGEVLSTNGSGVLSWSSAGAGFTNPMDSAGDFIYGGASGVATKFDSGSSGQLLTSGGAGAPTWTTLLPVANGGSAKALTLAAGGLLWTDADSFEVGAAGTSQQWALSGGTGAPTFSNTTTTGKMVDGSADEVQLWVQAHSTQSNPAFLVEGSTGTDQFKVTGINVQASTNLIVRGAAGGAAPKFFIYEDEDIGSNNIQFNTPADLTANWTWTLPDNDGTTSQWMVTDGSGVTSWTNTTTTGKMVDGSADEIQLTVQGNGTQTSNVFVVENSGGTDQFTVTNAGVVTGNNNASFNGSVTTTALLATTAAATSAWDYTDATVTGADTILNMSFSGSSSATGGTFIGFYDSNSQVGNIVVASGTGVTFTNTSDRRLKKDIEPYPHGLADVMAMKPRQFRWRENDFEDRGFIAQEMKDVFPWAVSGDETRDAQMHPMGVDYGRITPALVAAIQELKHENDDLRSRLDKLEKKNP